jgi:hypothetical protein
MIYEREGKKEQKEGTLATKQQAHLTYNKIRRSIKQAYVKNIKANI